MTVVETFGDRFLAATAKLGLHLEDGISRSCATGVLLGVPWRLIPARTCERRKFIFVRDLAMLCACLDDEEVRAIPGKVTADQIRIAWTAAGFDYWLKRETLGTLIRRAVMKVQAENIGLVVAAMREARR